MNRTDSDKGGYRHIRNCSERTLRKYKCARDVSQGLTRFNHHIRQERRRFTPSKAPMAYCVTPPGELLSCRGLWVDLQIDLSGKVGSYTFSET